MTPVIGHELQSLLTSLLPLLALLAASAAALLVHAFMKRRDFLPEAVVAVAGLGAAVGCAWYLWPGARIVAGLTLVADRLSMMGLAIVGMAACFVALVSPSYLLARGETRGGYFSLLLLATLGMGLLVMSSDLITLLLSIETMSFALYALAGFMRDRPQSVEGALKYFIMGAFATAFFCMGIAFLFGSLGSTDLGVMAERSAYVVSGEGRRVFLFGLAMLVVGLAFKVAAVPFHAWAPDAYDGAPTPVAMLIATAATAAVFIAFLRFSLAIAVPGGAMWHHLSWGLAALTMVWGNLAALKQENLKRMLAYSSIAHAGCMLIAFTLLGEAPVAMARALLAYVLAYTLSTAGAFAAISAIGLAPGEPVDIRHLSGLSRKKPVLSFVLSLFLLSLAGFPPTLGFFGKYYLFMSAVGSGEVVLVVIAAAGTVLSFGYYLKPVIAMYFRKMIDAEVEPAPKVEHAFYAPVIAVLAVVALAVIAFGLFPENLIEMVLASVQ
jgi:NADH-quinone oxidoreductase subunit N